MTFSTNSILVLAGLVLLPAAVFAQAENVPVRHPVYPFLKRMEVRRLVERYHDAVLPLSRRQVAAFLDTLDKKRANLSAAENGWLSDFLSEFEYDRRGTTTAFVSAIDAPSLASDSAAKARSYWSSERVLYGYRDSAVTLFLNVLGEADARIIRGDALGNEDAEYLQLGARVRGTVFGRLGYYAQATNAQFYGSRELLALDPTIGQSHALSVTNIQNFDFTEGYLRYDGGIVSAQAGRERVFWGSGYHELMTLSDNVRDFDFLRLDAEYGIVKYSFMHAWLLGTESSLRFTLPPDTTAFYETVIADKYFAAHRLELSFPGLFDIGGQEMVIYSNRSVDLAYLTPIGLIESLQRSRGERDKVYWLLDVQAHMIPNVEVTGTLLLDDFNAPDFGSNTWSDRYAWQLGMMYVNAFTLANTALTLEYTRVEPYVFSHGRSRDNSYTSYGSLLGVRTGPNSDVWHGMVAYWPLRNLSVAIRVTREREGENEVGPDGIVTRNVGGDVLVPHRDSDSPTKLFLDGIRYDTWRVSFAGTWEVTNQIWVDADVQAESIEDLAHGARQENVLVHARLRVEF